MKVYALKVRPKSHPFPLFAWLIMLFQGWMPWNKDAWSHNAVLYSYDNINWYVVDSSFKGVSTQTSEDFFSFYRELGRVELEPMRRKAFKLWLGGLMGRKYDFLQLFGLASKFLNLISFNKLGHNYKRLICAEVPVNYIEKKYDLVIGDPDNYDLEMTWELVKSVRK